MKKIKHKLRYFLERYRWVKAMFSPFKPLTVRWYVGKIAVGVPYFFPRKWIKYGDEDIKAAIAKHRSNNNFTLASDEKLYEMYKGYSKAVPLKVGFDSCSLGWKTKWTNTDFRYEWGPVFTFVFFGYQIAASIGPVVPNTTSHYWECWLYYEYATDKTKSKRERIEQCRKEFPQTWTWSSKDEPDKIIDYYERILRKKYLK